MEQFLVHAYPELQEQGSQRTLEGTLDVSSYYAGGMLIQTPKGIDYAVQLTNTGEGILVAGTVSCEAHAVCARCLSPVEFSVGGDVEGYYLLEFAEELEGYDCDEFECIDQDGTFDIAGPLEAALVYETPYVILCREDCAGLCPSCGADLNKGPCDCKQDDMDLDNPFAALKDFKFESQDDAE